MCINKKVVGGLVIAGLALYLIAPNLIGAALPLLVLAVCPLSMIVMMKMMSGDKSESATPTDPASAGTDVDAELAKLRAEVGRLRSGQQSADASPELN